MEWFMRDKSDIKTKKIMASFRMNVMVKLEFQYFAFNHLKNRTKDHNFNKEYIAFEPKCIFVGTFPLAKQLHRFPLFAAFFYPYHIRIQPISGNYEP